MEGIGEIPYGPEQVEVWIHRQLLLSTGPETIADELFKSWRAQHLTLEAKAPVGRFCLLNGFFPSLFDILKNDLRAGTPLPWGLVLEFINEAHKRTALEKSLSKELVDALLTGATRDKQLHPVAAVALKSGSKEERWERILNEELKERLEEAKIQKEKLFKDMEIFKAEGMIDDFRIVLSKVLALFPQDEEATKMSKSLIERDFNQNLDNFRAKRNRSPRTRRSEDTTWPDLENVIEKIKNNLDLEQAYSLSIGLHQMGLSSSALSVLRAAEPKWGLKETLWQLELLLGVGLFAEALNAAQLLVTQYRSDDSTVKAALYFSAKAYYGLEDSEQAITILQALTQHDPDFRDTAILLQEWRETRI